MDLLISKDANEGSQQSVGNPPLELRRKLASEFRLGLGTINEWFLKERKRRGMPIRHFQKMRPWTVNEK